ncbi:MAG: hypothetical protein NZ601_06420 [candidate division WOR-3 bacterium]|nr:hypothetical protein [candidate division WOR-3 bacterium]MCX7757739.1 hypothetical protein [candidate division WOR-3 bacterium]MDW7987823.1 hypothetical protein [candidate division WOR-3 bacterium]
MKENHRLRVMLIMIFVLIVIALGLLAIIIAMSITVSQLRTALKDKEATIYALQYKIDSLSPHYTEKQKKIIATLVGNPEIKILIKKKPSLGGTWGVWSEKNITFITEDKAFVIYDDGHLLGGMVIKITNPDNIKTWKVLWNTLF